MLEKRFHLTQNGTSVKKEVLAGLTTFFAMVYILLVNSSMFSDSLGIPYGAMYISTAISSIIGTVLIGLLSGLPFAQAPAMGLNAYFVYTLCLSQGFSYANGLVVVMIDGFIFILLTVTGLRKKIFRAIPNVVRAALPAGIGLFIAFLGLQNAGIVVPNASTGVTRGSVNLLVNSWADIMPRIVAFVTLIAIAVMSIRKVRGAIFFGILGGTALYYLLALTVNGFYASFSVSLQNPFEAFREFGRSSFGAIFREGFDFSSVIAKNGHTDAVLVFITGAISMCMVDMFDTIGTLYATCANGNMLDENGEVPNMDRAMLSDAIATFCGAVCGTSTVSTYVESASGVAEGGRTGLTSLVTAFLFLITMFLSPFAQLIPSCATAAALIYVGVLMMGSVGDIQWRDPVIAVPAFLTLALCPLTYSISDGIAFGLISYVAINLFRGKAREISPATWAVSVLFALALLMTH